ncbi:MAG: hypothetical protein ACJA1L_002924, partial [Paracoccaceae bacterium]
MDDDVHHQLEEDATRGDRAEVEEGQDRIRQS